MQPFRARLRIQFTIVVPGKAAYLFFYRRAGGGTGSKIGIDLSGGRLSSARGRGLFFSLQPEAMLYFFPPIVHQSVTPGTTAVYESAQPRPEEVEEGFSSFRGFLPQAGCALFIFPRRAGDDNQMHE